MLAGRCPELLRRAVRHHHMIGPDEPLVIGVSGGADSLCLLHLLHQHNLKSGTGWKLHAIHIDPGFEGWKSDRVERACCNIGVPCAVRRLDVPALTRGAHENACYICSRHRRQSLFAAAEELGCRKVALAHNMDDVNETFLINLLYASSGATLMPRQPVFRGKLEIIRPLYYIEKDRILRYLARVSVRPCRNRCPHEREGSRGRIRRMLGRLYRNDRRIRANLFWGIHNLKPEYLPGPVRPR